MRGAHPASTGPRIQPGGRAELGLLGWAITRGSGLVQGSSPPNLFRTLGRHRPLFRGWLRFAGRLMPGGTLPRRESEIVIVRVAHLRSCTYELEHHLRLGARAGLSAAELARLQEPVLDAAWSPRESAILDAVDVLHRDQDLDDATWAALRDHLDERESIELLLLVGHYEMLATTIHTLRVEPDRPRRG